MGQGRGFSSFSSSVERARSTDYEVHCEWVEKVNHVRLLELAMVLPTGTLHANALLLLQLHCSLVTFSRITSDIIFLSGRIVEMSGVEADKSTLDFCLCGAIYDP